MRTSLIQTLIIIFAPALLFSQNENWQVFLNSESVYDITVDDEKIWCSTNGGVVSLDKENYSLEHFNSVNTSLEFAPVLNGSFTSNSNLLFSNKGLHVFNGTEWSVYDDQNSILPPDQAIDCISNGYNETSLLGMRNGEIYRFDGSTIEFVEDLCVSAQFFTAVRDLYEDSNNSMWAGGDLGLCHYSNGFTTTYTSSNSGLSHSSITSLNKDSNGNLWMGTYGGGVNVFDGSNWMVYNMVDIGLNSNKVISLHVDQQDIVWAGTERGMAKFENNQWTAFTPQNSGLTGNEILSIASDEDGTIYVGTKFNRESYTGLHILKDGSWETISLSNSTLGSNSIADIEQNNEKEIHIAAGPNLSKFNAGSWERFQAPIYVIFPNQLHDIEFDSQDIPWVLLVNGIAKFENSVYTLYDHIGNTGNYDYLPRTLAIDAEDKKWMGTDAEGIFIFDDSSWSNLNPSNSPLISEQINDIERSPNGEMWVACGLSGGLFEIKNEQWRHYTNQNTDLPPNTSNWIWEIEIDQNNNKYVGTHSLCIFEDPFDDWTIYNTSNSELPQIDVDAIAVEEDGTLWIGTGNGLAKLKEDEWTIYNQANSPITDNAISDIIIDDQNNKWIGTSSGGLFLLSDDINSTTYNPQPKDCFDIAPNPNQGNFLLNTNGNYKGATIEVFNTVGQTILSQEYQLLPKSLAIELPNVSTGTYFCKISAAGKNEVHSIVISK